MARILPLLATMWLAGFASAPPGKFECLDLKAQANQKFTANFGSGRDGNDLAGVLSAGGTIGGVNFKFGEKVIQLGSRLLADQKPTKVEGINVGKPCTKIHILHATCWGNAAPGSDIYVADDTTIADYRVHYDDRTIESIPVVYGQDVRDWHWNENSKDVSRGKVVWKGKNELSAGSGNQIRLYMTTWANPHPGKRVTKIDYARVGDSVAAPFCVAITVEMMK